MESSGGSNKSWNVILPLAAIGVAGFFWFQRQAALGTKYVVSPQESVNYSGTATEADAKSLGEALQSIGFFDGASEKDVLLKKGENGTEVSFVVQSGTWNDEKTTWAFEAISKQIANSVGGPPVTVHLRDSSLNSKKVLTITEAESVHQVSASETVRYGSGVSQEQAAAIGAALQEIGYLTGDKQADVLLHSTNPGLRLSFVVQDGIWNEENIATSFSTVLSLVAQRFPDIELSGELIDSNLKPQRSLEILENVEVEEVPQAAE